MERTTEAILSLVRSDVFGEECDVQLLRSIVREPESYAALCREATAHDLGHIVGEGLSRLGLLAEDETSLRLRRARYSAIYRYRGIEYELGQITRAFCEGGVAHIPLKGSVIRALYPSPWMRTSCDIDILVREEELERASSLLVEELGYTRVAKSFHDVSFKSEGGVHVELHFTLIEDFSYPKINALLGGVWDSATAPEGSYTYLMRDDLFYLYQVAHMMKHLFEGGLGVRFFVDLCLLDRMEGVDTAAREALLAKAGLGTFAARSSALARAWFMGEELDGEGEVYARHIIRCGIYGNVETRVKVQQSRRGGKLSYAMRRIFLPYKSLREMFPILKKHKWLTPVFEVVRWFRLIFRGKLSRSINELKTNAALTADEALEAEAMLKSLGLE
ncbi:MAG: nucleotidyltransferase family protein [Clostridia bacterium]|nr:nucleotidyltransferase family protein [Clostridia bacterium]